MKNPERRCRPWRDARGISLIETLVALGLFAISAATIGQFLTTQIRAASGNHLYTQALALAAEELEATRALRFNDMDSSARTATLGGMTYAVTTTVKDDTPANGVKTISVSVEWGAPDGPQHVDLHTIYTEVRRF